MDFAIEYSWLIPLLPLIGAAVAGFFGARWLKGQSHWPIWLGVGAAAVLSLTLLFGMLGRAGHEHSAGINPEVNKAHKLFTWIPAGDPDGKLDTVNPENSNPPFYIDAGFWFDPLTAIMLSVVCGIGFLITVFAAGYMKGDSGYFRFFAYLGLFIFMMTLLVMGDNLIMLYLGWEGVGLCSYLLIGHYYDKPSAREAAKKAFLVNRVGDFGFGVGIMLCFAAFGTVSYFGAGAGTGTGLLELAAVPTTSLTEFQQQALGWIPFLLMLGAFGKSAQFPLYVWLPDAMEGPTPVSALIHAATMVTAGVYMIARCGVLFVGNANAMLMVALIGAFTALFAATIALRQFDLKKVFAYSTISQLGFMFVGVGVLAPVAGVFHLVTHAFFKALLFLSSGVVMHAMLGHLDMRLMSGLKTVLPKTRWLILIGCLALAGFPLITSGFYSKDEIVSGAMSAHWLLGLVMLFTAFLTAYYTFRLYFRVFEGPLVQPAVPAEGHHGHDDHADHGDGGHGHGGHAHDAGKDHGHDHGHHNHEPLIMILPLALLAVGALLAGFLNFPAAILGDFLGESASFKNAWNVLVHARGGEQGLNAAGFGQHGEHHIHWDVMAISGVIAIGGIALAYLLHLKHRQKADQLAGRFPAVIQLLEGRYWVDEIYQYAIVEPLRMLGRICFAIDRFLIDGLIGALSWAPRLGGWTLKLTMQRGSLQGYASAMLFGIVVILILIFL